MTSETNGLTSERVTNARILGELTEGVRSIREDFVRFQGNMNDYGNRIAMIEGWPAKDMSRKMIEELQRSIEKAAENKKRRRDYLIGIISGSGFLLFVGYLIQSFLLHLLGIK